MFKWKREQIENLITIINQNPCIYDVKSTEYLDRQKKAQAFNSILANMQKMEISFTLYEIKRKWKNLRTQYAQELRAINLSKKSGNTYVPKLWCFEQLNFLNAHIEMRANKDNTRVVVFPKKEKKTALDTDELLELATKRLRKCDEQSINQPTNYSQSIANVWASEFMLASGDQQFFAKKAIDDILYEARLGTLHQNSVKINHYPERSNASDATLEPSRITSSPIRSMPSQSDYSQYSVHLPNESRRSSNNTPPRSSKSENYSRSYSEINGMYQEVSPNSQHSTTYIEHVSVEPDITIQSGVQKEEFIE